MAISQIYETTIVDTNSNLSAHFVVVPRRSLSSATEDTHDPIQALDLHFKGRLPPGQLHLSVLSLIKAISVDDSESWSISFELEAGITKEQLAFSEYLTCASIVPFENSPLSTESLGSLVTSASGVGMGAFAGFVVAGHTPLLFVLVPAGMLLFGAAAGVAKALEEGLRERILRLISHREHA